MSGNQQEAYDVPTQADGAATGSEDQKKGEVCWSPTYMTDTA